MLARESIAVDLPEDSKAHNGVKSLTDEVLVKVSFAIPFR